MLPLGAARPDSRPTGPQKPIVPLGVFPNLLARLSRVALPAALAGICLFLPGKLSSMPAAVAQTPPSALRFGVVSIRIQSDSYRVPREKPGPIAPGGKYIDHSAILWSLMAFAHPQYVFPEKTVVGLPVWAYGRPGHVFDFEALPAPGTHPDLMQMEQMMDRVLSDRFALRYHVENRVMAVLYLRVRRGAPTRLQPAANNDQSLLLRFSDSGVFARGASMDEFAGKLGSYYEDRPVLNRTGLGGFYDIDAKVSAPSYMARLERQSMIARLVKDIGLELDPGKASVPVMVVDHVAMPTPN